MADLDVAVYSGDNRRRFAKKEPPILLRAAASSFNTQLAGKDYSAGTASAGTRAMAGCFEMTNRNPATIR